MRSIEGIMTTVGAIRMHSILILLIGWYTLCDSISPFRWRSNGQSSGVMLNTANVATTFTPIVAPNGHGHGVQVTEAEQAAQADIIYGNQYASAPKLNYNHNYHNVHQTKQLLTGQYAHQYTRNYGSGQTHKRQFRNPFAVVYEWRQLDFDYPTFEERQRAILSGDFIPINAVPLGVDRWRNRLFVTMPRWKNGIPASLATLPLPALERSAPMRPYPSWEWHADPEALDPDCTRLMSVYRIWVDECDRLWVLDSGIVNATIQINPVCPPKIVVFDLHTDQPIFAYDLPPDQVKQDSLHSNLIVDIRKGRCQDAHAYITDVWRFGITVFSLAKGRSWRTTNHLYFPNPDASDFTVSGLNFQWTDGVFGMSLSPINEIHDRLLFFHPMSSVAEFMVSTSVLRNESSWTLNGGAGTATQFVQIGERGARGQSSTSGIDRNNVQFYTLVQQNGVGCWRADQPYYQGSIDVVAQDNVTLVFPNDLKIDQELEQSVWVISNRLPIYLYSQLDYTDVNFRIQKANAREAIFGTACDPQMYNPLLI